MPSLSPAGWHARFMLQARWTQEIRRYIANRLGLDAARQAGLRFLEVGCGTGALFAELEAWGSPYGLDLDREFLNYAASAAPRARLVQSDANQNPFAPGSFDLVLCHYFLLWVANPLEVLSEMRRVTRPGGYVLALAEPDHAGRIDYPPYLDRLGQLQTEALLRQGAAVDRGRQLSGLFVQAGLQAVESGLLGGHWAHPQPVEESKSEWEMLRYDLNEQEDPGELFRLQEQDRAAWENGSRVLFVPTFYAWGQVPFNPL